MKEGTFNDLQRKKAIIMGLFIAKYDKKALESFGFTSKKEAYNVFGYSVNIPPSSIKLYQQDFDRFFPHGRNGWKRPIRANCLDIMEQYNELNFDDFHKLVNSIVLDKYVDISDIKSNYRHSKKDRQYLANRMITGKAAEEYFVRNYQNIPQFENYLLTDTTNMGCGFDYKLTQEANNFYIEVKGINERHGSVLMTEKEYNMAEDLLEKYCLFVVSNFKDKPIHQLFFNPIHCGNLVFQKKKNQITQINYHTNVI